MTTIHIVDPKCLIVRIDYTSLNKSIPDVGIITIDTTVDGQIAKLNPETPTVR